MQKGDVKPLLTFCCGIHSTAGNPSRTPRWFLLSNTQHHITVSHILQQTESTTYCPININHCQQNSRWQWQTYHQFLGWNLNLSWCCWHVECKTTCKFPVYANIISTSVPSWAKLKQHSQNFNITYFKTLIPTYLPHQSHLISISFLHGWRCGVVVTSLVSINEVNLCWAWLVVGWVTVSGFDSLEFIIIDWVLWRQHFISVCNQPPRLTQPSAICGTEKWVPAKGQWCSAAGEWRQAWCNLQVKLCDPCLRALEVVTTKRYINRRILYF